jgi:hypothetical protein
MVRGRWRRLSALPDGGGPLPFRDPCLRRLHAQATKHLAARAGTGAGRLRFACAAVSLVLVPVRLYRRGALSFRSLRLCWREGATPGRIDFLTALLPEKSALYLPDRLALLCQSGIGDQQQSALLRDKLKTGLLLLEAGLPVPPLMAVLLPGDGVAELKGLPPGTYFFKPRFGFNSRNSFSAQRRADGVWLNGQGLPVDTETLAVPAGGEPMLVQPFIAAAGVPVTSPAAVLRLTVSRLPGQAARLHSAYCVTPRQGGGRTDYRSVIRYPVDPETGRMEAACPSAAGEEPVAGRLWPDFDRLRGMVLKAADLVPGLPLTGWDVICAESGPVFLEGNVGVGGILPDLRDIRDGRPSVLPALYAAWLPATG